MDRKFLEDMGLDKQIIDNVLDENSKDVGKHKKQIDELTTQCDSLQEQVNKANEEINSYKQMDIESIKEAASNWETKYNEETAKLKQQMQENQYKHLVERQAEKYEFSSGAAKRAFIADLSSKDLKVEDDKLLGFDDFVKAYKESDPNAFKQDQTPPPYPSGTGTNPMNNDVDISKMSYQERVELKQKDPKLYENLTN